MSTRLNFGGGAPRAEWILMAMVGRYSREMRRIALDTKIPANTITCTHQLMMIFAGADMDGGAARPWYLAASGSSFVTASGKAQNVRVTGWSLLTKNQMRGTQRSSWWWCAISSLLANTDSWSKWSHHIPSQIWSWWSSHHVKNAFLILKLPPSASKINII